MRIYPLILIIVFFSCNPSLSDRDLEIIDQSEKLLAEVKQDRDERIMDLLIRMQSSVRTSGYRDQDKEIVDSAMNIYLEYKTISENIENSGEIPPKDSILFIDTDPEFIHDFLGDWDFYSSSVPQTLCFESRYTEEIISDLTMQVGNSHWFDKLGLNIISYDDSVQLFFSNAIYACGYIINGISINENLDISEELYYSPWAKVKTHKDPVLMRVSYTNDNGQTKERSFNVIKNVKTIP